jgi:hypothetical protein
MDQRIVSGHKKCTQTRAKSRNPHVENEAMSDELYYVSNITHQLPLMKAMDSKSKK